MTKSVEGTVQKDAISAKPQEEAEAFFSKFKIDFEEALKNQTKENQDRLFRETGINWEQVELANRTSTVNSTSS